MRKFNPDKFPVRVTLCFKNGAERDYVLGQMSDGWGEDHLDLDWKGERLHGQALVGVRPAPDEYRDYLSRRRVMNRMIWESQ